MLAWRNLAWRRKGDYGAANRHVRQKPAPLDRSALDLPRYGAAASKDQAGIVFRAAAQLVRANANLLDRLKILDSTRRITRHDRGGFYAVLSADGDVNDGIEPSLAIVDELHRWKRKRLKHFTT